MKYAGLALWARAPFIRIIIPFMVGIVVQDCCAATAFVLWTSAALCSTAIVMLSLLPTGWQYVFRQLKGLFLNVLLVLTGALLLQSADTAHLQSLLQGLARKQTDYTVVLETPPAEKKSTWKYTARITHGGDVNIAFPPNARLLIYLRKKPGTIPPPYGYRLQFTSTLQPILNTGNTSFDYRQYCARKHLYFQVFLAHGKYKSAPSTARDIPFAVNHSRDHISATLRKFIPGKTNAGMAEALLIGLRDDVDPSVLEAYKATGVVHVIAVSGLHLGLIYLILKTACKPLQTTAVSRAISLFITISGMWAFTLLAGAAPSIVRAAVMFTCVLAGQQFRQRSSLINSLCASAFLLLCYNPFWLWDAGFQLSYTALLGISVFSRPLQKLFHTQMKIVNSLWQMIAATLAAQILTTPLSIFYFHQFPNLFLPANIIAVPLSSLILVGEIILCACAAFPAAATPLGLCISASINFLNQAMDLLAQMPFAATTGLQISLPQTILLYLFIAAVSFWRLRHVRDGVPIALIALILFFADYL